MPRMNGLELTGQLLRRYPRPQGGRAHPQRAARLPAAAGAGRRQRLPAQDGGIARARGRRAHRRQRRPGHCSPPALEAVLQDYVQRVNDPAARRPADDLTAREREVLKLIAEGHTNQEIAVLLCLSRKTVETHRGNIMDKLDLHKVTDLVKYAIREGGSVTLELSTRSRVAVRMASRQVATIGGPPHHFLYRWWVGRRARPLVSFVPCGSSRAGDPLRTLREPCARALLHCSQGGSHGPPNSQSPTPRAHRANSGPTLRPSGTRGS